MAPSRGARVPWSSRCIAAILACSVGAILFSVQLGYGSFTDRILCPVLAAYGSSGQQQVAARISELPTLAPPVVDKDPQELFGCQEQVRLAREEMCRPFALSDPSPRVLITGGAGFIGGHLVRRLRHDGVKSIKVIDNLWRGRLSNLCDHSCHCSMDMAKDFCLADLTDSRTTSSLFANVEVVYHLADVLAGISFVFANEHWLFQQNVMINTNVLQACVRTESVKEYIYVGSACSFPLELQSSYEPVALREDQTYPAHPESAYGWSKLMGEYEAGLVMKMEEAKRHGLKVGLLRFHNVYGPHSQYVDKRASQALPALVRKAVNSPKLEQFEVWGSSKQYRDFVYVDDVVETLLRVRNGAMNEGVIQVGTGEAVTLQRAAEVIADLTLKCLGKSLTIHSDASRLEGDSGRVAVRDRAQKLLKWQASVFIEEGLAKLYSWILEDMRDRNKIEPWMFENNMTVEQAIQCLTGEATASKRSEPLKLPGQIIDGRTMYQAKPSTMLEQLGGKAECDHSGSVDPPENAGTLVVVICSTRGHHLTWRAFDDNVLRPLQADLALAVSSDAVPSWEANSFRSTAKYVWMISEPPENDYQHWFDEIAQACFGRRFTTEDAAVIGQKLPGIWLGLIKATKHRTASSVLIYFRWLALQHLQKQGLLSKYKHIIITRSDYMFVAPHPQVSHLQPGTLMIPDGEGYGGVTDRHTVMHSKDAARVLSLAEKVVFASGEDVAKYWLNLLGEVGGNGVNLESILDKWYRAALKLSVTTFRLVMFIVYDSEDGSAQRAGEAYLSEVDPYVISRVHVKYYTEYNQARGQAAHHKPFDVITDKMMNEVHRNMSLLREARERQQSLENQQKEREKAEAKAKQSEQDKEHEKKSSGSKKSVNSGSAPAAPIAPAPPPQEATASDRQSSTVEPLAAPAGQSCFALPEGDGILGVMSFAPPASAALKSPDPRREPKRQEVRQAFARLSKDCSCTVKPFEQCPHGVGSSLASMLKPFTQAFIDEVAWDMEAPLHLDSSDVGLMHPTDDCSRQVLHKTDTACKKQVRTNCHFWHWKEVKEQVPLAYRDMGLFWWTAQQWTWLLRPTRELAERVATAKENYSWEDRRPILGIHVRHGDSCMSSEGSRTARKCEGLEVYMKAIDQLKEYGYKSIFLATDDFAVAQQARDTFPQYYWLIGSPSQSQARNKGNGWDHRFEQMAFESGDKSLNLKQEFQEVLTDIHLLSDVDGFIGKFTSNVDRIAYALNVGRRGCAVPFVSLDAFWCNDYGMEKGKTATGAAFAC